MTATDSGVGAPRKVVCADAIDPAIVQATFGDHVSPPLVDFGARYVLHLAGGVQCDLRAKTKTLGVSWAMLNLPSPGCGNHRKPTPRFWKRFTSDLSNDRADRQTA